ncbi:hypothetical protein KIN20_001998 [Parelaphostrongylus tenuis]|uniref:Uncharacterized protein n=1 Tax=Parelaphostrongylus tenuis TaxID=148309 RepID=A0AAD5QHG9_PARTN|nr:hypothetical protein KIN20_001998 [Parelaphostrongylus tenuis]
MNKQGSKEKITAIARKTTLIGRAVVDDSNQLVQIFSSTPCIRAISQQPFLVTNDVHEIVARYTPDYSGRRIHFLTAVDVSSKRLLNAWMACAKAECPIISKTYDMRVPINEESIIAKKLPITNPYSIPRTFRVASSRSDVVEVGDTVLDIDGLSSTATTLYFHNVFGKPIRLEVMIYVFNAESNQLEETIMLNVAFTE